MKSAYDIILRPVVTERSMEQTGMKKYAFEVAKDANKIEIRRAVEEIFGVKVLSVNTIHVKGKEKRQGVHTGYRPDRKKAIVRLTDDSKTIEFFEGMV
jgi:large subunit ribosomal protein L23